MFKPYLDADHKLLNNPSKIGNSKFGGQFGQAKDQPEPPKFLHRFQNLVDTVTRAKVKTEEQNQNRRRYCVYLHHDQEGKIRYVGHGLRSRAWSIGSRNEDHRRLFLNGELRIKIYRDQLTAREAVQLESDFIDQQKSLSNTLLLNRLLGTQRESINHHV